MANHQFLLAGANKVKPSKIMKQRISAASHHNQISNHRVCLDGRDETPVSQKYFPKTKAYLHISGIEETASTRLVLFCLDLKCLEKSPWENFPLAI